MKLPSIEECLSLEVKYGVPENVRLHSSAVRSVANYLAQNISMHGYFVDLDCVDKAALLHDCLKFYCIKNKCRHAIEAGKVLAKMGFEEFGKILRQHGLEEVLKFNASTSLEAKIVWYADKRVNHGSVVSMRTRYEYFRGQYGSKSQQKMQEIISTEKAAYALEKELVEMAGLGEDFLGGTE